MINTALLKEQLKRFWGLSALLFTGYALIIALPIYDSYNGHLWALLSFINMRGGFIELSVLFAPLVTAIVLFKFQNQVKSVTAMHSYPLTRNQILSTNALVGMILLILPLLVLCIIVFFPIHQYYQDLLVTSSDVRAPRFPVNYQFGALYNSILATGRVFFVTVLSFLLYFSLYTLAAMLTGNSIITLLLCAALPLLPIGIYTLTRIISEQYVFGFFYPRYPPEGMMRLVQYTTGGRLMSHFINMHPILFSPNRARDGFMFFLTISYSAAIITLSAFCVFAANKRALERESDFIVFPYVKNVLVLILSVCGLLLMGFFLFGRPVNATIMFVWFIIGFFTAYCIAKTFSIISKMNYFIKFGAIAVGLLLLIIITIRTDIFGYERYVPHITDVEGIQMLDVDFLFIERDRLTNSALSEVLVKDTEIINETIALHQAIINEREALRQFQSVSNNSRIDGHNLNILYKLKNGRVIARNYRLPESFMYENDFHSLLARSRLSISLLQNRPDLICGFEIFRRGSPSQVDDITKHDHLLEFSGALMKDYEFLYQQNTFGYIRVTIVFEPSPNLELWSPLDLYRMNSLLFEFEYSDSSHTIGWLHENGYLD